MAKRFPFGYDADAYVNEALRRIRVCHPWATLKDFHEEYSYAVEKEGRKHVFVSYYTRNGKTDRDVIEGDGEAFIKRIISDHQLFIEYQNDPVAAFRLELSNSEDGGGWAIEIYEFRKHEKGGLSSYIQAGNRSGGASRTYFFPESFLEGKFTEFISRYNRFIPDKMFCITRDDLEMNKGLKDFFGFSE